MQRSRHLRQTLDVMQLAIRQQDRPGDTGTGFLGQGVGQRLHQKRTAIAFAVPQPDDAQLRVRQTGNPGFDVGDSFGDLVRAHVHPLAGTLVHDQDHDIGQRVAFLNLQGRIRDRQ